MRPKIYFDLKSDGFDIDFGIKPLLHLNTNIDIIGTLSSRVRASRAEPEHKVSPKLQSC